MRLCLPMFLALVGSFALADECPTKLSVLIMDGVNNHDWPRATKILRNVLEDSGRFTVDVSTSPTADGPQEAWGQWRPRFTHYDVVVSNFNGGHKPTSLHWPGEVEKALEDYVSNGGGLVVYHSANNSFPNWSAYNEVMDWTVSYGKGRVYVTMLGHLWKDKPDTAMRCIGFHTMLIRGCEWAATGDTTYPMPADFPTDTVMKLRPDATVQKSDDQLTEMIRHGETIFCVRSPSGIGRATLHRDAWPDHVRLRLYLRGLEKLEISSDSLRMKASVLSHSGHVRLLHTAKHAHEKTMERTSDSWTEIQAFDANGKPLAGLPGQGGYFELVLPKPLLEANPKSLTFDWIDFYRQ